MSKKNFKEVNNQIDFVHLEHEILDFWNSQNIFSKLVEKNKGNEPWSFMDGPITANNPMGVHHAWGRTLKDVFQRFNAMKGRDQRFQNGFDCQGLWVEVEVEKELGFSSKRDIEEFGIEKSKVRNDLKFYLSMIRIYERTLQLLFPEILYSRLQIKMREESKS